MTAALSALKEILIFGGPDPSELVPMDHSRHGGAQHLRAGFIRSLLSMAKAERITVVTGAERKDALREALAAVDVHGRVAVQTFRDLADRPRFEAGTVIHGLDIGLMAPLHLSARFTGGLWPVTAMTHDLFDPAVFSDLMMASFIDHPPLGAIACASRAARSVLLRMLGHLASRVIKPLKLALPIVHHGMDLVGQEPIAGPGEREAVRRGLNGQGDSLVLLYVGRLSLSTKADLSLLITACSTLRFAGPVTLVMAGGAGDPLELAKLRAQAATAVKGRAGLRIVIEADISNPRKRDLLAAADVVISPANSPQESFGLALVEALAAGLPVIASDWNGYRDIISHGKSGLLVPTTIDHGRFADLGRFRPLESNNWLYRQISTTVTIDSDALRHAIDCFAHDPAFRQSCSDYAKSAASAFTCQRMIERYERLWHLLLVLSHHQSAQPQPQPQPTLPLDWAEVFLKHPTDWTR